MRLHAVEVDLALESRVGLVRLCDLPESFVGTPHEDGFGRGPASLGCRKDRAAKATSHHLPTSDERVLLTVLCRAKFMLNRVIRP